MAADIQGDAQPEFLVRGPRGLHAFTLSGHRLPMHSQSFTDAQGWNLTEHYGTLQTAVATLTENGRSHARTLIVGRGNKGLEVYKFTGEWTAAAQSASEIVRAAQEFGQEDDITVLSIAWQKASLGVAAV